MHIGARFMRLKMGSSITHINITDHHSHHTIIKFLAFFTYFFFSLSLSIFYYLKQMSNILTITNNLAVSYPDCAKYKSLY